jgi:FkbM family methyltransferase
VATPAPAVPPARRPRTGLRRAPWFRRLKLFAKRLVGREPWLRPAPLPGLVEYDGWAFVPGRLAPGARVWAFGVGTSVEFELELVRRCGVVVDLFDPSPASVAWVARQAFPPALVFHPWALAARDGTLRLAARAGGEGDPVMYSAVDATRTGPAVEVAALTVASVRARLGTGPVALAKLDVEGVEFDVLPQLLALEPPPDQLLVEFHHRFPGLGTGRVRAALAALRAAGYRLVWLSATGREFAFVRTG